MGNGRSKCLKCLSQEDQEKMMIGIRDKFVQNLKDSKIDETTQVTVKLRETLANIMIKILSDNKNINRLGKLINEVINITLQKTTNGPMLLWCIMEQSDTYSLLQSFITKIFTYTYNNKENNYIIYPDNDIDLFINNLLNNLLRPPYKEWYTIKQVGGKTMKKRRQKNKKRRYTIYKRPSQRGGENGNENQGVVSTFQKLDANEENIAQKKAAEEAKAEAISNANLESGADISEEEEMKMKFSSFNKKLLEALTKRINETSNLETIMEKIMAASYLHAKTNNVNLINSVNKSLHESITQNNILNECAPIILAQALYNSSLRVKLSIIKAFEELRKNKISLGELKEGDYLSFEPTKSEFIVLFMNELKENVKREIIPSYGL